MYQICISGASKGESAEEGAGLARQVGIELARAGHGLLTGATTGIPRIGAEAYSKAKGKMSIGLSPASSRVEHVKKYRLPVDPYDAIIFSGLNYVGRDTLLINSADAVISIGGRIGTLHEFTIAMELETPIAFLQGAGGISTEIMNILHAAGEPKSKYVIFGDDAADLVKNLIGILDEKYKDYQDIYA